MIDNIIKELSDKYGKDERVIRAITNSPFVFTKTIMRSFEDDSPIRLPYFGAFVLRHNMNKVKKQAFLLRGVLQDLVDIYEGSNNETFKEGVMVAIDIILEHLKKKGVDDEQFVQHFIDWKNRI